MTKLDPIIAVKDVELSSKWYQTMFNCKSMHGGSEFEVLKSQKDEVLLCLHKWGEHDHPPMQDSTIAHGNGLILYFRTENFEEIRQNTNKLKWTLEEEIHLNKNSKHKEFSLRDPDGYYLTISDYHQY